MRSQTGRAVLDHFNLSTDYLETMLYVENGIVYTKSLAFLKVVRLLPWPIKLLSCLSVFPESLRNFVYDRIARYRYRLFGVSDVCLLTEGTARDRFV